MTDLLFPPSARISKQRWDHIANTAASRSPFTGAIRTLARTGDRWRVGISTANGSHREDYSSRAALQAIRAGLRGQANRIWIMDSSYAPRGTFPAAELLTNNAFQVGTTGWSAQNAAIAVADRVLRLTLSSDHSATPAAYRTSIPVTQYVPLVGRCGVTLGRGMTSAGVFFGAGSNSASSLVAGGIATASIVGDATTASFYLLVGTPTTWAPGDSIDFPWTSLSRCALVDNGVNLLLRSDAIDNAAWTKVGLSSVSANVASDPIGTTTADQLIEDTSNGGHYVYQDVTVGAPAADYAVCIPVVKGGVNYCWLSLDEGGATSAVQYFDINAGTVGVTGSTGAGWSNRRAFIHSLGNGYYLCCLVARKTTSATVVRSNFGIATSDSGGGNSYVGSGVGRHAIWRATLAPSGVPVRFVQTTTAALPSGALQTGAALRIKGLPPSTSGLLLAGDIVQIGTQLNKVIASLDSDAAGLGYLQCATPWRSAPADNAPIIINNPMGRFVLTGNEGGWDDSPGGLSDLEFEFEEALDL